VSPSNQIKFFKTFFFSIPFFFFPCFSLDADGHPQLASSNLFFAPFWLPSLFLFSQFTESFFILKNLTFPCVKDRVARGPLISFQKTEKELSSRGSVLFRVFLVLRLFFSAQDRREPSPLLCSQAFSCASPFPFRASAFFFDVLLSFFKFS